MMRRILMISILSFIGCCSNAQNIINYKGKFNFNDTEKLIKGTVTMTFENVHGTDTIELYINRTAIINFIEKGNKKVIYYRAKQDNYLDDVKKIKIPSNQFKKNKNNITIDYSYSLSDIKHDNFKYRADWIELSFYTGWFPFMKNRKFTYDLDFDIPENFHIASTKKVRKKRNTWRITNKKMTNDIVIIISNELNKTQSKNKKIEINYVAYDKNEIEKLKRYSENIFAFFEEKYGKSKSSQLVICANPFNHPMSYARKGIVSLSTKKEIEKSDEEILAHEIAHLWWSNSKYGSWEEWLGESFSEFSSIIWMEHKYGKAYLKKTLETNKKYSNNTKSIVNITPDDNKWYHVIYLKGSLILNDFKDKIGEDAFFNLLKSASKKRISNTSDLLNLIEKEVNKSSATWLKEQFENR